MASIPMPLPGPGGPGAPGAPPGINPGLMMALSRMAGGANQPMAGPAGPTGTDPTAVGRAVASQLSAVRTADPRAMTDQLKQMKQVLVQMFAQSAMSLPQVSNHLSTMLKGLNSAVEAAQRAATAAETTGASPTAFNSPPLGISMAGQNRAPQALF